MTNLFQSVSFVSVPVTSTGAGHPGDFAADGYNLYVYTGDGSSHSWNIFNTNG